MVNTSSSDNDTWRNGLLDEQTIAASHEGSNARLLAGPGTGKTWTLKARVEFLVLASKVEPEKVTALTFTRAAAGELRNRVSKALEGKILGRPKIMTLHSFALRTLLRNAKLLDALPKPLRIADDWEERNIIQEDLKVTTSTTIAVVQEHLRALSADWDTLRADDTTPNPLKADATFVSAWQQHRISYGYTLRSELVYQLKRALEQRDDLELEGELEHLLVDEYQDLNACDLSVIARIAAKGAQVYAAGDDDQSIYGFRHANPEGIRRFDKEHAPSKDLPLKTCMRCDRDVMELARFVADLDRARLKKPWEARKDAGQGDVRLLSFSSGDDEAAAIASLCKYLITEEKYQPDEILILIRSDQNGAFSRPLAEHMATAGVLFHLNIGAVSPLDSESGRVALSFIRLAVDENDSLAWRTLLQVRKNGVGAKAIAQIAEEADNTGNTFAAALRKSVGKKGALTKEWTALEAMLAQVKTVVGKPETVLSPEQMRESISRIAAILADAGVAGLEEANAHIAAMAERGEADSFTELLSSLSMAGLTPEQDLTPGAVNMLTMHKAKGLSARAVIIMACEDEYLPGRQQSVDQEGDERRLLYVSLTRARERLFITYSQRRFGQQQHTGRDSGKQKRTLTRYLRHAPVHAIPGAEFIVTLGKP
jgi:ATP-dependent DNA helicase UvrD/PcrA